MTINNKINCGETGFFLMGGRVVTAKIYQINPIIRENGIKLTYIIDKNPLGDNYTTYFSEFEIFPSKEDLLKSL